MQRLLLFIWVTHKENSCTTKTDIVPGSNMLFVDPKVHVSYFYCNIYNIPGDLASCVKLWNILQLSCLFKR